MCFPVFYDFWFPHELHFNSIFVNFASFVSDLVFVCLFHWFDRISWSLHLQKLLFYYTENMIPANQTNNLRNRLASTFHIRLHRFGNAFSNGSIWVRNWSQKRNPARFGCPFAAFSLARDHKRFRNVSAALARFVDCILMIFHCVNNLLRTLLYSISHFFKNREHWFWWPFHTFNWLMP